MAVNKEDRRRKLTDEQREEIIKRYSQGESKNSLATKYKVRRYTISTVVNPDLRKRDYLRSKDGNNS